MPFTFKRLEIPDVILIEPKVSSDERGFFLETYKITDFSNFGIKVNFIQDNHSKTFSKGILRGLHYQENPKAQAKLVRVINGSIFDVAVDIRKGSPTYGRWVSAVLSAENKAILYIPVGFAHGFVTLEDNTETLYRCSDIYSPDCERGIIWNDKDINITWPVDNPVLSGRDLKFPSLKGIDNNFTYE